MDDLDDIDVDEDPAAQARAYAMALRGQQPQPLPQTPEDQSRLGLFAGLVAGGPQGFAQSMQHQQQLALQRANYERQLQALKNEQEYRSQQLRLQQERLNDVGVNPITGQYYSRHGQLPTAQQPVLPGGEANPFAGLKPKDIEAKWKDLQTGISTSGLRGSGRITADLQERLNNAGRLEALIKLPSGDIAPLTPSQVREGATTLASLISTRGSTALGQIEELVPHTLAQRFANLKQLIFNQPESAEAQDFLQNMLDTAGRERVVTKQQLKGLQLEPIPGLIGLRKLDKNRFDSMLRAAGKDSGLSADELDERGLPVEPGGMVPVVSPEGKRGKIPAARLEEALKRGFKRG